MGGLLSAVFGGLGLTDLIKYAVKFFVVISVLGLFSKFTDFLLSLIPPLIVGGCAGHFMQAWGFIDGFRLFVSIVLYGFIVKVTLSLISRFFD
jgi:hypothetical protein